MITLFFTLVMAGVISPPIRLATFPTLSACTTQLEVVKAGMEAAYPGEPFTFFCKESL